MDVVISGGLDRRGVVGYTQFIYIFSVITTADFVASALVLSSTVSLVIFAALCADNQCPYGSIGLLDGFPKFHTTLFSTGDVVWGRTILGLNPKRPGYPGVRAVGSDAVWVGDLHHIIKVDPLFEHAMHRRSNTHTHTWEQTNTFGHVWERFENEWLVAAGHKGGTQKRTITNYIK